MNIIVMGPQGSGKSTQAKLLAEKLNLPHLQTGKMYRRMMKEDSPLGRKIKNFLDKGEIVSDRIHLKILEKEISKSKYKKGFVLDGTPRTLNQAKKQPFRTDTVFYFRVSDSEGIKRLLKRAKIEKRADDTPELIKARLSNYHRETEPVLDYFRKLGILEEVDGERSIEVIFKDIMKRLKKVGLI